MTADLPPPDPAAVQAVALLPCPFCGGEGLMSLPTCTPKTPYNPTDRMFPIVSCCSCYGRAWGRDEDYTGKTAIAAWNRRAHLAAREGDGG